MAKSKLPTSVKFKTKRFMPNVVFHESSDAIRINFKGIEEITGKLYDTQMNSINAILSEMLKQNVTLKTQQAYILATAWHESYFKPIKEAGSDAYLKRKKYWPYFGRGFVQLTWDYNYKKQGDRLGIDLMSNPDLALQPDIAANILVYGMLNGSFTGKKLSLYINSGKTDFPEARRVINGTDKATEIAAIASKFLKCLLTS